MPDPVAIVSTSLIPLRIRKCMHHRPKGTRRGQNVATDSPRTRRLTVKLRGRAEAPDGAEGAQFLSARGAKPQAHHGPLQRLLAGGLELFAKYPSQRCFKRFMLALHVLTKCCVDHRLVVATTRGVYLRLKPGQHVVI